METATTKKEEAAPRLQAATRQNFELILQLKEKVGSLRDELVGAIPTSVDGSAEKVEPSGLIFKVASDLEHQNNMLNEIHGIIDHLQREFSVGQPKAKAS